MRRRRWLIGIGIILLLAFIGSLLPDREESSIMTPTFVEEVAAVPTNTIVTTPIPTLVRATVTSTSTSTLTLVPPTLTLAPPSATPLLTNTLVPTIPTSTFTPTRFVPSSTPTIAPTPIPQTMTYYINSTGVVNARPCPHLNGECAPVVEFNRGDEIQVIGTEPGDSFSNSETWYQVLWNGDLIYVHSYFVSATRPVAIQQPAGGGSTSGQQPVSTPAVPPPAAPPVVVCDCFSGDTLNCSNFSRHSQAQACHDYCMGQVGRDVHGLDGTDNDGLACESLP